MKDKYESIYVIVTKSCQLHCSFCYNSFIPYFKEKDDSLIDPIQTAKVIDKLNVSNVIFHGGEPLLYPETIIEVIENVKNKNVFFSIQTNLAYDELNKKQLEALCKARYYGTSYNLDRFIGNKKLEEKWVNNVKFLDSFNLSSGVIFTITPLQLKEDPKQVMKYLIDELGIDSVTIERVIYPIEEQKKDPKKYKEIYKAIDEYMLALYKYCPDKKKLNLYHSVKNCIQEGASMLPNNCHEFTCTLTKDKLILGCPSLEGIINNPSHKAECKKCNLYQFCQEDCECMRIVCAFPKKTFGYIATDIIEELDEQ